MSTQESATQNLTLVQAVRDGLYGRLARDDDVVVLGEDVGENGGVFRATQGLYDEFGPDRVIDTPLAESGIVGAAVGMAAYGMKPVPEIQFSGFAYPAFDQIVSHAARLRSRSRGRFACSMTLRMPLRRRHPRARTPLGVQGSLLRARTRAEGRHPVDAPRREGVARRRHSRPGPRRLHGTKADLPGLPRRGARRRVHRPARRGDRPPRGRRRLGVHLGRDVPTHPGGRREPRRGGDRRRGRRPPDAQAHGHRNDRRLVRKDRPRRRRPRSAQNRRTVPARSSRRFRRKRCSTRRRQSAESPASIRRSHCTPWRTSIYQSPLVLRTGSWTPWHFESVVFESLVLSEVKSATARLRTTTL